MPCALYDAAGTFTWTWPAGVTQAFVSTRGASAGGGAGTIHRGAGAGGGGAFAAKLLTRTDATATVVVGAAGAGATTLGDNGAAGGGSTFSQASTSTEICGAAGGGAPGGPTGGTGGAVADSDGDIVFAGGNGGSRDGGDGGGGGGAAACETAAGANGANESAGGAGGQVCPGTAADGTGGGNGGTDGIDGANGEYGGGGGGGTNAHGGNGSGGRVLICWAEPVPTGYCYPRQCWWPNCGYYGGYNCYYYGPGYYGGGGGYAPHTPHPYGYYGYGAFDVVTTCCPAGLPKTLYLTVSDPGCAALDGATFELRSDNGAGWSYLGNLCPNWTLSISLYCDPAGTDCAGLRVSIGIWDTPKTMLFLGGAGFGTVCQCEPLFGQGQGVIQPQLLTNKFCGCFGNPLIGVLVTE
jgi:hypothetical protein